MPSAPGAPHEPRCSPRSDPLPAAAGSSAGRAAPFPGREPAAAGAPPPPRGCCRRRVGAHPDGVTRAAPAEWRAGPGAPAGRGESRVRCPRIGQPDNVGSCRSDRRESRDGVMTRNREQVMTVRAGHHPPGSAGGYLVCHARQVATPRHAPSSPAISAPRGSHEQGVHQRRDCGRPDPGTGSGPVAVRRDELRDGARPGRAAQRASPARDPARSDRSR